MITLYTRGTPNGPKVSTLLEMSGFTHPLPPPARPCLAAEHGVAVAP